MTNRRKNNGARANGEDVIVNEMITCPLCGNRFFHSRETTCSRCPFGSDCRLICCPNCAYQWPAESTLVNFVKKMFKSGDSKHD